MGDAERLRARYLATFGGDEIPVPVEAIAEDLNGHNDAYPLARPSEAAALATLQHEDKIRARGIQLRQWTEALAAQLREMGVRTFPTHTYFLS